MAGEMAHIRLAALYQLGGATQPTCTRCASEEGANLGEAERAEL